MIHDEGEGVRLGIAPCEPQASFKVLEAGELKQVLLLDEHGACQLEHRLHGGVGEIRGHGASHAGAVRASDASRRVSCSCATGSTTTARAGALDVKIHSVANVAVDGRCGSCLIGERGACRIGERLGPAGSAEARAHPLGVTRVRVYLHDVLPQAHLRRFSRQYV